MELGGVALEERLDLHSPDFLDEWERIFKEQEPYARRIIRKYIKDSYVVDEVVDDVFFSLYKQMERGEGIVHLKTYIAQIAYHSTMNFLRESRVFESIDDVPYDPNKDAQQGMSEALTLLSPHYRSLLMMRFYYEMSGAQIARIIGQEERKVRHDVDKALVCVRRLLHEVV